ncbi:MAG: 16S rRNA (adenine(1518)-N(6)/adenine(1519)-N(6))-dimethyltransferase RsmA [Halioglobus sp.]|nr:16S rRNA (adenine(1518)-N(6)/adenine(1519)-N(6))-dimethyltransferase RsmA [Halioglobus sp.]
MNQPQPKHRARKRFGQNFLHDASIIDAITAAVQPRPEQHLVEIGPGMGALTEALVSSGCTLDVIELDRDLVPGLLAAFCSKPGFTLHNADALDFDFAALLKNSNPDSAGNNALRVVGNLPYNISTPLIFKLLQNCAIIADMHFMLQREVVERLAAVPGNKHWGRLGIMAQYHCQVEHLFDVPPTAFRPEPKVQSAIVRLTPWATSPWPACNERQLRALVKAAFAHRRKTLRNNLKEIISGAALEALGIDPGARAETLQLTQFIEITNALHAQNAV